MAELEFLAVALILIASIGSMLYLPFVVLNRFFFVFFDPDKAWVRVLRRPIGPRIPSQGASRPELLHVARHWSKLLALGVVALAIEATVIALTPRSTGTGIAFLMFVLTATFVFIGLVDLVILLLRCLLPRRGVFNGQPATRERGSEHKPPNHTLQRTVGGGLGAEFIRTLAHRR